MIDPITILRAQRSWRDAALADAQAAARDAAHALAGLEKAVAALTANLRDLGYPPVPGVIHPEPGLDSRLRHLEATVGGAVPPILVAFWQQVGGISLVDLEGYSHVEFWKAHGVTGPDGYCDGVHVDPCSAAWVESAVQEVTDLIEDPGSPPLGGPYLLPLAPDGYHKDNISGGVPYGIEVGGGWLAPWQNFSWTGPRRPISALPERSDLLGYLRTSILECAGFPALLGVPAFEPFRERLLRNVEVF
ncbi:hypothetical protein [Sorangium sp. So ce341]|uniref:hypothetical protein n=1 Tax=Sorangium sp. So ce341 TaxID=3133302 RepID=UPI003F63362E